jgi:hypothetical protein
MSQTESNEDLPTILTGRELLDVIEQMDNTEVSEVYYKAIHMMQAKMQSDQGPF